VNVLQFTSGDLDFMCVDAKFSGNVEGGGIVGARIICVRKQFIR
jgi:hypothetical protein